MQHTNKEHSIDFANQLLETHLNTPEETKIQLKGTGAEIIEAFFLGTKGDNSSFLNEFLIEAVRGNLEFRKNYFPDDPDYVNETVQNEPSFIESMEFMRAEHQKLVTRLQQSGTFFSMRSIGHMLWDTSIPGILGYFAALLYNQNNVAAEASPVTTILEMEVGNELCKMLGYPVYPIGGKAGKFKLPADNKITGWGHITCDGSVANLEGLWMARNLKFYPVSVKIMLLNKLMTPPMNDFKVTLLDGSRAVLTELDDWTILNLPIDEILAIPENIFKQFDITDKKRQQKIMDKISLYSVQNMGYYEMLKSHLPSIDKVPVSLCSATRHYSWPKGAAILGIGADNMISIYVDNHARMKLDGLREYLDKCLRQKIPLLNVVVIIGTTEESAVDPLDGVLNLREEYRKKGLEFAIHADAAWGGYFKTMLISPDDSNPAYFTLVDQKAMNTIPMSSYTEKQYRVLHKSDSITIDPHKSGYVPYPAGGLCYRNSAMRNLVAFTAPVVYHGGVDPTVGVYGVEGSKPGAAAASAFLSHKVIRPNIDGYGKISGRCFFNAKRLYAALVCLNIQEELPFFMVPLIPIPAIQAGLPEQEVQNQYEFIRDRIVNVSNVALRKDDEAFALFKELGGDQTIITYMYNFYNKDGTVNSKMALVNSLNDKAYKRFSYRPGEDGTESTEIVVTSSNFTRSNYGDEFIDNLRKHLGVSDGPQLKIDFLISTIMNPWLSETLEGSFIPTIIEIIIRNLTELACEIRDGN